MTPTEHIAKQNYTYRFEGFVRRFSICLKLQLRHTRSFRNNWTSHVLYTRWRKKTGVFITSSATYLPHKTKQI